MTDVFEFCNDSHRTLEGAASLQESWNDGIYHIIILLYSEIASC